MALTAKINDKTKQAFKKIRRFSHDSLVDYTQSVVEVAKERSPRDTGNNASSIAGAGAFVGSPKVVADGDSNNDLGNDFSGATVPPGMRPGEFRVYTRDGYGGLLELFHTPYIQQSVEEVNKEFQDPKRWTPR